MILVLFSRLPPTFSSSSFFTPPFSPPPYPRKINTLVRRDMLSARTSPSLSPNLITLGCFCPLITYYIIVDTTRRGSSKMWCLVFFFGRRRNLIFAGNGSLLLVANFNLHNFKFNFVFAPPPTETFLSRTCVMIFQWNEKEKRALRNDFSSTATSPPKLFLFFRLENLIWDSLAVSLDFPPSSSSSFHVIFIRVF